MYNCLKGVRNVETEALGQLRVEQTDDVAPRTEVAGVVFDAGRALVWEPSVLESDCKTGSIENLPAVGWWISFFMPYVVARRKPARQHFLSFHPQPCGTAMIGFRWHPIARTKAV